MYNKNDMNQAQEIKTQEKMDTESLKRKAMFLEELLSFVEDKALGFLMDETEKEENIPLKQAKELLS